MTQDKKLTLPVIGCAIRLFEIPKYIDWLVADQRDLEIQDPCYPGYLDEDFIAEVRKGRALLNEHGYTGRVGLHGAFDGLDIASHDKQVQAVVESRLMQSLEFGAELGATHMVIHSPFYYFGSPFVNHSPSFGRHWMIDGVHQTLKNVVPAAEKMGCTIVIETILDTNPQPLIELVKSFESNHVRVSLDTGHAFIMQQVSNLPPDQWVYEAGELLGHLHVQDNDGFADRHWAVGDGNINWRALFRALLTTTHTPRLVLEVQEIQRSFDWLVAQGLAR